MKNGVQVSFRLEEKTDLEQLLEMFFTLSNDTLQYLPIPITRERVEKWVKELDHDKALVILVVIEEGEGRIIGSSSLSFNDMDYNKHKASFGITVHDDYQDIGLGSILTGYMIDIARAKGLMRIELEVVAHNSRAIRVYEKNGFVKEGHFRKNHWNQVLGKYCDDIHMSLTPKQSKILIPTFIQTLMDQLSWSIHHGTSSLRLSPIIPYFGWIL